MNTGETSLHFLVDKWLAPAGAVKVRVVRSGRMPECNGRFVYIETSTPKGPRGMFFFRHDDGCWRVFPPCAVRPSMCADRLAA